MILDDFKYDFDHTKKVLLAVEAQLKSDQFVDGVPEGFDMDEESAVGDVASDSPEHQGPGSSDSTGN